MYKNLVNNGISYQPQLVNSGFLNHQLYFWLFTRCSMYGIFTYIYHKFYAFHVGKYGSPMGAFGSWCVFSHGVAARCLCCRCTCVTWILWTKLLALGFWCFFLWVYFVRYKLMDKNLGKCWFMRFWNASIDLPVPWIQKRQCKLFGKISVSYYQYTLPKTIPKGN